MIIIIIVLVVLYIIIYQLLYIDIPNIELYGEGALIQLNARGPEDYYLMPHTGKYYRYFPYYLYPYYLPRFPYYYPSRGYYRYPGRYPYYPLFL